MKPAPTETSNHIGAKRWIVDNMSGKSVMRVGELTEVRYDGEFGSGPKTDRYYVYGPATVGGPIPDDMPRGASIDRTTEADVYIVTINEKSSAITQVVMGKEIFHKFGFSAPST